jgi:AraC-like DNA-binding protein
MADRVRAWNPGVPDVREVLHATFDSHAYPQHTHEAWTVLVVDEGAVRYVLHRGAHHAVPAAITLLPPYVPHDGRSAVEGRSFRKRVLYLDPGWLPPTAADLAVSRPTLVDERGLALLRQVHADLTSPPDAVAVGWGVQALHDLVEGHLGGRPAPRADVPLARRLRAMLDDAGPAQLTVTDAARALGVHPGHLVRSFTDAYGIPPHRYATGRRVDHARRLLLGGVPPARAAADAGFHDQAHLTRHFRRVLGTTPAAFASSTAAPGRVVHPALRPG